MAWSSEKTTPHRWFSTSEASDKQIQPKTKSFHCWSTPDAVSFTCEMKRRVVLSYTRVTNCLYIFTEDGRRVFFCGVLIEATRVWRLKRKMERSDISIRSVMSTNTNEIKFCGFEPPNWIRGQFVRGDDSLCHQILNDSSAVVQVWHMQFCTSYFS